MDSKLVKFIFYCVIALIFISMCSCTDQIKIMERVTYTSKTSEGVPVYFTGHRFLDSEIEDGVIDNALDRLIEQYSLPELLKSCDATAKDLETYFGLSGLEIKFQQQHYKTASVFESDSSDKCSAILNKPGL